MRFILLPALLSAGTVAGAIAAPLTMRAAVPDQTYEKCQQAAQGITTALLNCDRVEGQRLDSLLNDVYKKLMAALPDDRKNLLRLAQRDWIAFRHDECNFRSSVEAGGSDAPLLADSCALELTRVRIDELKKALAGEIP